MSEVLLKQLEQILAPWDTLPVKNDVPNPREEAVPSQNAGHEEMARDGEALRPPRSRPSVTWAVEEPSTSSSTAAAAYFTLSRAATTRLELARAALALFASNAGMYRPFLVKVFRFLFDHVDELREEQFQLRIERAAWRQESSASLARGLGNSGLAGSTPEEQNAVAAAYEKVRLTETRMEVLVEEAAVQRDHFKSQMETLKRHQYHLEDLLRHQMEMAQVLLDHRLHQDLMTGHQSSAVTAAASAAQLLKGSRPTEAVEARTTHGGSNEASAPTHDFLGFEVARPAFRSPERRDAEYVQRLISRAESQLILERTEDQLREVRAQYDGLQNKLNSLLKLNSRYAHQAVELSARLSILHEHNIALAADVQLFQRDFVRERQRTERLQHEVSVARGVVLTMLQVQPDSPQNNDEGPAMLEDYPDASRRRKAEEKQSVSEYSSSLGNAERVASANTSRAGGPRGKTVQYAFETPPLPAVKADEVPSSPTKMSTPVTPAEGMPHKVSLDAEGEMEAALQLLPDADLRLQLQNLLAVSDAQNSGIIKSSLLRILHLHTLTSGIKRMQRVGNSDAFFPATSALQGWLSSSSVPKLVAPYGLRPEVPSQLRSRYAVPRLVVHPVVAEVFVHELLSQRQEVLWFAQQQLEEHRARVRATEGKSRAAAGGDRASSSSGSATLMSLPEFIELFILTVWLKRPDRYLPLLPPQTLARLVESEHSQVKAHRSLTHKGTPAGSAGGDGRPEGAAGKLSHHITLWDLRHVVHSAHSAADLGQLPSEALQLTYALNTASLQLTAGPLTYAYGLTSRGTLCEALFDLFRAERSVFLELCRAVEVDILTTHAEAEAEARLRAAELANTSKDAQEGHRSSRRENSFPQTTAKPRPLYGSIPVVQVARILVAMYPGYSVDLLEQLMRTAVEDGTNPSENPTMLFYEALLPGRMLPGRATATMSVDTSQAVGTAFASIFYTTICDDAQQSMQMVEDSVAGYARGPTQSNNATALSLSANATVTSVTATATAQQLTSLAFLGIPRSEVQCWGPALRSVIYRWRRLRTPRPDTSAEEVHASPTAATVESQGISDREQRQEDSSEGLPEACKSGGFAVPSQRPPSSPLPPTSVPMRGMVGVEDTKAAAAVSSVARVPLGDVMPYLRSHLLLRRGLYIWAAEASLSTTTASAGQRNDQHKELLSLVAARAQSSAEVGLPSGWAAFHEAFLQRWEGWCSKHKSTAAPSVTLATEGPTELATFNQLLMKADPYRTRAWGSEELTRDNPLLHPISYAWEPAAPTEGFSEELRRTVQDSTKASGGALTAATLKPNRVNRKSTKAR